VNTLAWLWVGVPLVIVAVVVIAIPLSIPMPDASRPALRIAIGKTLLVMGFLLAGYLSVLSGQAIANLV